MTDKNKKKTRAVSYAEALKKTFLDSCNLYLDREDDVNQDIDFEIIKEKYERLLDRINTTDILSFEEEEECHEAFVQAKCKFKGNKGTKVETSAVAGARYKLPKLELIKYDVTPRTWIAFWGQYRQIHEDNSVANEDKFQYLKNCLKDNTKARKIVDSYPPSRENYDKALNALRTRFGSPTAIIEIYTRDLIQIVVNKKNGSLSELYDNVSSKILAESLGVTSDNVSAVLYPLVQSTLPAETARAWERERNHSLEIEEESVEGSQSQLNYRMAANPLNDLLKFMEQEVLAEERISMSKSIGVSTPSYSKKVEVDSTPTAAVLVCKSDPKSIKKEKCIFCDCDHPSYKCTKSNMLTLQEREEKVKANRVCFHCLRGGHYARACRIRVKCEVCNGSHQTLLHREKEPEVALYVGQVKETVYLKTVMVRFGTRLVRVLFDDASSRSYIKESLARELKMEPVGTEFTSYSLFGNTKTKGKQHSVYEVDVGCMKIRCLGVSEICCDIPRVSDEKLMRKLEAKGVYLSDVGPECPPIEMLIGAQSIGSLLTGKCVPLNCGVTAQETKLGWTIVGSGPGQESQKGAIAMCNLSHFWQLEDLGIESCNENGSNEMDYFAETIKVNDEGRYEVGLPWKAGHPPLEDNRVLAEARLKKVMMKLDDNDRKSYNEVFQRWEDEGVIECVSGDDGKAVVHYLPHRPVLRPGKSTPVRPVFDASCKGKNGVSLNDCLEKGPNLIKSLPNCITKFRAGRIGITADIKAAFLQISVIEEDRDKIRFLLLDEKNEVTEYRHKRVVFGLTSSPFLLNITIQNHLNRMAVSPTVEKLQESFYVDDCIASVDTYEEAEEFIAKSESIMEHGKFELRKWKFSGSQEHESSVNLVLGLKWDLEYDTLSVKLSVDAHDVRLTKRGLLSVISQIFDPIGILTPALVVPKLLLQEMWKNKLEWDEALPKDMQDEVRQWLGQLNEIESCRISRWSHHGPSSMNCCTLHIFADGSSHAYACVVYLRCVANGIVNVKFVGSKARVVPLEKITIPRVELLAALIAVRFVETLGFPSHVKKYFYTDSTVALAWITKTIPWKNWVGNRVTEIRGKSPVENWWHVDGSQNPADLPSRGCNFKYLSQCGWLSGPLWLLDSEVNWPCRKMDSVPNEARAEERTVNLCTINDDVMFSKELLRYFSDYSKIIRMVAWMLRLRVTNRNVGPITAEELTKAELVVFRIVQRESLDVKKHSNLQIEVDAEGTWHVKTRLTMLEGADENFITPVVLVEHPLIIRMIEHEHRKNCHAGVGTLLTILREKVWLLRGRQIIKKVIKSCVRCKRFTSSNVQTETVPLPKERINAGPVFRTTGVDLAGPLYLKGGLKAWIVLFTCSVYRAVHLELVTSLSTEAFLMSLRRFIARRGRCEILWSDQGTNFKGAEKEMSSLDWSRITNECAVRKIQWNFNPASAPWWGGWWERLVGVVKNSLKRTLGVASLNYEEMLTVLSDVESVVNRRPLTFVGDEQLPLTPWDFMTDAGKPETMDLDEIDSAYFVRRAKYVQKVRDHLRERFRKEYIGLLASRPQQKKGNVAVGDLVLVGSDNVKRVMWPIAKVLELYPGKDGISRVAKLKTATGTMCRALQRLYPLELNANRTIVIDEINKEVEVLEPLHEFVEKDNDSVNNDKCYETQPSPVNDVRTRVGRLVKHRKVLNL